MGPTGRRAPDSWSELWCCSLPFLLSLLPPQPPRWRPPWCSTLRSYEFAQHEGYDLVSIEGAVHTTEPAEPMLPVFYVRLLLPPGSSCTDMETSLSGTVSIPGRFDVLPAPRPVRLSSERETEVPQPSSSTYDPELPYPLEVARLAGVGSMGGYRIATVRVTPLQYVAATGELILHTNIEVCRRDRAGRRRTGRGCSTVSAPGLVVTSAVSRMVDNDEDLSRYATSVRTDTRTEPIDYLLITAGRSSTSSSRWPTGRRSRASGPRS